MFTNIFSRFRTLSEKPYIVVGFITLFGALVRLYHLGYKPLTLDEARLYWISRNIITEVIRQNAILNSAPPLFALITSVVLRVSESETALRFLPWLGGILAVPATYYLSKQFSGRIPSYVAAFLVALATNQVKYSQQVREYSLTFLIAILILAFFCRLLQQSNWRNSILLSMFCVAGIFLQYGLALLILAMNFTIVLELLWQRERKKVLLLNWMATQIPVVIATVIVYNLSLHQQMRVGFGTGEGSGYLSTSYWNGGLASLVKLATFNTGNLIWFTYPGILFLFLVTVGIIASFRVRKYHRALALFVIPFLVTFVAAVARLYPYNGARQDIYLTPMIYLLAGLGVSYLLSISRRHWVVALLATLICISGLLYTNQYLNDSGNENIRPVVRSLLSSFKEGDRIYVYYAAEPAFTYYFRDNQDSLIIGVKSRENLQAYFDQLDTLLLQKGRVWMVFSHCYADECEALPDYISKKYGIELITEGTDAFLYVTNNVSSK